MGRQRWALVRVVAVAVDPERDLVVLKISATAAPALSLGSSDAV